MANIMTVSKGHDLDYAWRQVAAGAGAEKHRGAGYYLSAAEAGEPPGVWWGPRPRPWAWYRARSSTARRTT
jgi:hypothetical protein